MSLLKIALSLAAMALLAADAGSHGVSLAPASLLPGATPAARPDRPDELRRCVVASAAQAAPALAAR